MGGYLTHWSGPEGELKRMKFHLGLPCHPRDTLIMTGRVVRKDGQSGEHPVEVEYDFLVPQGSHCRGTAAMCIPR